MGHRDVMRPQSQSPYPGHWRQRKKTGVVGGVSGSGFCQEQVWCGLWSTAVGEWGRGPEGQLLWETLA